MDLLALLLLLLLVLACLLVLIAPVLRVRETSHHSAGHSLVIQSLPLAVALAYWAFPFFDPMPSVPVRSIADMGAAPALAFGLQLVATPMALRPASLMLGARGVYTVLSAGGALGIVLLAGALHGLMPTADDTLKLATQRNLYATCLAGHSATFVRPRADLEQLCDCASRRAIAEVDMEVLRKASLGVADAMELANLSGGVMSAQASCVVQQFGGK